MRRVVVLAACTVAAVLLGAAPSVGAQAAPSVKPVLAARVSGPATAAVDGSVTFVLSRSMVPKGDRVSSYSLTFGDGTRLARRAGEPRSVSHEYAVPGTYVVKLVLTDSKHKSSTGSLRIVVSAPEPVASVACTTTSSGSCIRGGEFCPAASEGETGIDASGDRYVCQDSDNDGHPHWENP